MNLKSLSDSELLSQLNNTEASPSSMSDDELLDKLNNNNKSPHASSFGKGLLSSLAEVPSNIGKTLATVGHYGSEQDPSMFNKIVGGAKYLTPTWLLPSGSPELLEGNLPQRISQSLEEDNLANKLGQITGDVTIGALGGSSLGSKGLTTGGKILNDAISGGIAGGMVGGPNAVPYGAIGGGALSGTGRALGAISGAGKGATSSFKEELKNTLKTPMTYGIAAPFIPNLGGLASGLFMAYPMMKGAQMAARFIPPSAANAALRTGSTLSGSIPSQFLEDRNRNG